MENADINRGRKRPWRTVLLVILLFVTMAGVLVGYEWWRVQRELGRLNAEIAKRRAAGEPVLLGDFERLTIADGQNAAVYLRRAASAMRLTNEDEKFLWGGGNSDPVSPAALNRVEMIVAANQGALTDIRRARGCGDVWWDVKFVSPIINTPLPHLGELRNEASLVKVAILHDRQTGNWSSAAERLRDMLFLSHAAESQGPFVSHLVGIGINSIACEVIERIAPDLLIADSPGGESSSAAPQLATPAQVRAVITQLLDEKDRRQHIISTWQYERMQYIDSGPALVPGKRWWRARVIFYQMAVSSMRTCDICREASLQTTEAEMQRVLATMPKLSESGGDLLAGMLRPAFMKGCEREMQSLVERRAAAINLAMRLYAVEHQGQLPAKLGDLVPKYLDSLPADPMSGRDFIYRPGPRAILYSVGEDGKDDGGDETRPPKSQTSGRWVSRDAVFHLARQQPTTAPTKLPR